MDFKEDNKMVKALLTMIFLTLLVTSLVTTVNLYLEHYFVIATVTTLMAFYFLATTVVLLEHNIRRFVPSFRYDTEEIKEHPIEQLINKITDRGDRLNKWYNGHTINAIATIVLGCFSVLMSIVIGITMPGAVIMNFILLYGSMVLIGAGFTGLIIKTRKRKKF